LNINELFEILLCDSPSVIIRNKEESVFELIPELKKCKNFNQNSPWHIFDVYEHILHVIDNVPNNIIVRLAALFHDIGKPEVYIEDENGVGHFFNHWIVSKEIFERFAITNNLDDELKKIVSNLIYYHDINIGKLNNEQLEQLLETFNEKEINLLFQLKRADLLAQNEKFSYLLDDYKKQEKNLIIRRRLNERE
jgi:tRNA nucleotidyltransferase (CCA-adding enzyme)